ncbi:MULTISPECIES: hypothetical protein [Bacillus amyloliquefaciens group]
MDWSLSKVKSTLYRAECS